MTDNYERMEIDGKKYVMIPEDQWAAEDVQVDEELPAWWEFVLNDESRVNLDIGLFTNVLLPLGSLLRTDDTPDENAPLRLSRILRSVLTFIWSDNQGWLPQADVDEGWAPNPDIILVSLAKLLTEDDDKRVMLRLQEIATEAAMWLEQMLTYTGEEGGDADEPVEAVEEAQEPQA